MTTMYPCERVDESFIQSAPFRFSNSVDLAITPKQFFEVLAKGHCRVLKQVVVRTFGHDRSLPVRNTLPERESYGGKLPYQGR